MKEWVLDRLKEKSTWKGISILAGLLGVALAPDQLEIIGTSIVAIIAAIEVLRKEA